MSFRKTFRIAGLACFITILSIGAAIPGLASVSWTKTNGVYVGSDGSTIAGVVARGIDVSHWKQSVDWNAVAADDIQFVMVGARYDNGVDPYFDTNVKGASAAGLKVGVYLYSYATTVEMAKEEAAFVLNLIKDYPVSYPVVFDVEAPAMSTLSPSLLADIINAFCGQIKDAGYYPMLYANDYWLTDKIDMTKVKYDVWAARYEAKPSYSNVSMWQATNQGKVSGVSGDVDINFSYKDFSSLIPKNQWRQIGGNWYYYANYQKQTGWVNDGNGWYYMKDDGTQYKGWVHIGDKYYYLNNSTGKMVTGWMQDSSNSKWYYFNETGEMATGWVQTGGETYYLNTDGAMVTQWLKVGDNTYYYLKSNGSMATGWYKVDNTWYYFNPTGEMLRGWIDVDGSRYYLNNNGAMAQNWLQIDNIWYYFGSDGAMRTGWQYLDGAWYYLNSNGQMLTGWQLIDKKYYYLHEGKMLTGWLNDSNGQTYFMDKESGDMSISWKQIDGNWYYFDQYGHMQKGWLNLSGKYYYLDPETGKMTANVSRIINNVNYTFDKNGVCQNETSGMSGITDSYFDPETVMNTTGSSTSSSGNVTSGSSSGQTSGAGTTSQAGSAPTGGSVTVVDPTGKTGSTTSGNTGSIPAPGSGYSTGTSYGQTSGSSMAPGSSSSSAPGSTSNNDRNTIQPGLTNGPGR